MFEFTEPQKQLYQLIANNGAFVNPQTNNISAVRVAIDNLIATVSDLDSLDVPEQEDLEQALLDLDSVFLSFLTHTNRLSGVIRLNLGTIPDIIQLLGVSNARQQLKRVLGVDDEVALQSALELFGSLIVLDNEIFGGMSAYISTINKRLEFNPSQFADVLAKLQSYETILQTQINADNAAYNAALNELYVMSMTYQLTTFVDPVSAVETIVGDKIGSPSALNLIEQHREDQ